MNRYLRAVAVLLIVVLAAPPLAFAACETSTTYTTRNNLAKTGYKCPDSEWYPAHLTNMDIIDNINAGSVDGFDASQTPAANTVAVAGSDGKLDEGFMPTSVNNATTLAGYPASKTPAANTVVVTGSDGTLAEGFLPVSITNAHTTDGFHASQTPTANTIAVADSDGRLHNNFMPANINSSTLAGYPASKTPAANTIAVAGSDGLIAEGFLPSSAGNAQTLDGYDSSDFELVANKDQANGYTGLDAGAKVPLALIPDQLTGKNCDTLDTYNTAITNTPFAIIRADEAGTFPPETMHSTVVLLNGSGEIDSATIPDDLYGKDVSYLFGMQADEFLWLDDIGLFVPGLDDSFQIPIAYINSLTPCFSAHANGTTADIANATWTAPDWQGEEFDDTGDFDTATGRFTPSELGPYLYTAALNYNAGVADQAKLRVGLFKNGALHKSQGINTSGTGEVPVPFAGIANANGSTDYFELKTYHETGAGQVVLGNAVDTWWMGCKAGR